LHLALEAFRGIEFTAGWKKAEVIIPDFTMVACARAVTLAGMTPVFVDCGYDLNLNPTLLERAVTENTRAVMAVHVYGRSCDMQAIADFCMKYDLYLIEDLSEIHGLPPHPETEVACWSFYRNKIIAGEEGGVCSFRSPGYAETARCLRSLGFTDEHDYSHRPRGCNYRLADCLASLIIDSIRNYSVNAQARGMLTEWYDAVCPSLWKLPKRYANWVYDICIPDMEKGTQDRIVKELKSAGIEARHGFKPMSKQKEYEKCKVITNDGEHTADRMSREVIYLPLDLVNMSREKIVTAFSIISSIA
jgi:dTDP-4-amino-4,6-dideoxygalactose transaminase